MNKKEKMHLQDFVKTHSPTVNIKNMREFPGTLFTEVTRAFPDLVLSINRINLAVITAFCWIGPENDGSPPEEQLMCVVDKLNAFLPESQQEERVVEFVAAFGCGKWRTVQKGISTGWQHIWPGARKLIGEFAEIAVNRDANPWLKNTVKGFPYMHKKEVREYVHMFLERFLFPEFDISLEENECLEIQSREDGVLINEGDTVLHTLPHGIKYVFSKGYHLSGDSSIVIGDSKVPLPDNVPVVIFPNDNIVNLLVHTGESKQIKKLKRDDSAFIYGPVNLKQWECHCGHYKCKERHRLSEWIPARELCNYIFSAIKGPRSPVKSESFTKGMYFPTLSIDVQPGGGRLRYTKIEYKKCHKCGTEYEGSVCVNKECEKSFDPQEDRKLLREVLFMFKTEPAVYTPHQLYRCPVCQNMYDLTETVIAQYTHCAYCHQPRMKKEDLAHLWKNDMSLLMKVRILHQEIKKHPVCDACGKKNGELYWCPLHKTIPHGEHSFGYLPQRPTYTYSRTFYRLVSKKF